MTGEARLSEEKAKKAMVDAARLADELRGEQELAQALERDRKLMECQCKEMQARLDEAETNAKDQNLGWCHPTTWKRAFAGAGHDMIDVSIHILVDRIGTTCCKKATQHHPKDEQ